MNDQQFAEFMALLKEQHRIMYEVAGQTLAGVNEATYYLRMQHEYNQAVAEAEAENLDPEAQKKDEGTMYAVRLIKNGTEKSVMFYAAHPEAQRPTGKLYWDKKGIEPAGVLDWDDGPFWDREDTPTKDKLATMPGMLRPLGGTLTFIKTRYPAKKDGGYDRWPIEKIVSWVPDGAAAATPAPTRPPQRESTVPATPPPALPGKPTSTVDGLRNLVQDAKMKCIQAISLVLKTQNEGTINAAADFFAKQWALSPKNDQGFKDGRTEVTFSDLSDNQIDALTEHIKAHSQYWMNAWRDPSRK
jgi:hypothetical protein